MWIDWLVANIGSLAVGLVVIAVIALCGVVVCKKKK